MLIFDRIISTSKMSFVFLDISIGKAASHRIIIELFDTLAPKTCLFFKSMLSSSPGYKHTAFHRIIEDFMIQGGSIPDSTSLNCPPEMENTAYPIDREGLVGLARTSPAEKNAQFFITLAGAEHLTGRHAVFGRVVKGMEGVEKIGRVEVDEEDRPVPGSEVVIVNCGELQQRQKKAEEKSVSPDRKRKDVNERERSVSPGRERESRRRRSRSPRDDERERRRRSSSRDGERSHRHHHHHRHRRRSENGDDHKDDSKDDSRPRDSERRHSHYEDRDADGARRDSIPTGPRGYKPYRQSRPESNYGRLGYDTGYDDWRDDEDRLRDIERQRDAVREREEPEVIFKGRGAMKFREHRTFGSNRY